MGCSLGLVPFSLFLEVIGFLFFFLIDWRVGRLRLAVGGKVDHLILFFFLELLGCLWFLGGGGVVGTGGVSSLSFENDLRLPFPSVSLGQVGGSLLLEIRIRSLLRQIFSEIESQVLFHILIIGNISQTLVLTPSVA